MKHLLLKKTEINKAGGKYLYQVVEFGNVIAERKSHKDYVACYVDVIDAAEGTFYINYCFGRIDLVGKGESGQRFKHGQDYYALATITQ